MKKKKFKVEVVIQMSSWEVATIEVEANNASEAKGIAKYRAERDRTSFKWEGIEPKLDKIIRSKVIGVDSEA